MASCKIYNRRLLFFGILGTIFFELLVSSLFFSSTLECVLLPLFFFLVLCFFLTQPVTLTFRGEGLRIDYFFGFYVIILWHHIQAIERRDHRSVHNYVFQAGETQGKKAFFTQSQINATKKTKALLRQYWNKNFNGTS